MDSMWLFAVVLISLGALAQTMTLMATVNSGEVMGTVTFTQANGSSSVTVTFALSGPKAAEVASWQLHTHRLNYDAGDDRCATAYLGPRIAETVGGAPTSGDVTGLSLMGLDSLEGHSIAFIQSGVTEPVACATIESDAEYVTASATFVKGILGHVIFRQVKSPPSSLTVVSTDLFSDGSSGSTSRQMEWRVVDGGDCSTVGTAYSPTPPTGTCTPTMQASCAVGDLTGNLGAVNVGVTMGTSRTTLIDLNLPLSDVIGKTLQLFADSNSTTPSACVPIHAFIAQRGVATFDNDGVTGTVTLTQPSPLDPTSISVALSNLRSLAGGYHVHKWPVPASKLCDAASVSGHWNPFNVSKPFPAAATTSNDMYEVGDLSSKFGYLTDKDALTQSYSDWNLPLFGRHSVMGRSIVIHKNDDAGSRWVCTNVISDMANGAKMFKAKAVFKGHVEGEIELHQHMYPHGIMMPTTVIVNLRSEDGNQSLAHNWHVHQLVVGDDATADTGRCSSTGGHYNPFQVDVTGAYVQCGPANPLRCEVGDQAHKLGTYDIGSGTMMAMDVYLPLAGPFGVIGRSFVIHVANKGPGRYACADIMPASNEHSVEFYVVRPVEETKDTADFLSKVAPAINTETYNLAMQWTRHNGTCSGVHLYFLGMEADELKKKFMDVKSKSGALGGYKVEACDEVGTATVNVMSLAALLFSTLIGRLLST